MDKAAIDLVDEGADIAYATVDLRDVTWLDCWHAVEALVKAGWRPRGTEATAPSQAPSEETT